MTDQMTDHYTADPEYLALLRGVLEFPEDDAYRLILSDWLEEHDDAERAEFIRVQILIESLMERTPCVCRRGLQCDPCREDPELTAALSREDELFVRSKPWLLTDWEHVYLPHRRWVMDRKYPDTAAFVRRGFVSEVRLTAAAFMGGGSCLRCGDGVMGAGYGCPSCAFTGRVEGLTLRLFAEHPITNVVLTCRKPSLVDGEYVLASERVPSHHTDLNPSQRIPSEIFDLMPDIGKRQYWQFYSTEADAMAALSRACVAYGRALAGLPPLDKETA